MGSIMSLQTFFLVMGSAMGFVLVSVITPGPNNLMLAFSGAHFGYRKTIPHQLGVLAGMVLLLTLCGFGLGALFIAVPQVQQLLKVLAAGYILYLAWRLLLAPSGDRAGSQNAQPLTIVEAMLFQFVNPKAWMMGVTAISSFTVQGEGYWLSVLAVLLVFMILIWPCISVWTLFGQVTANYLARGRVRVVFNTVMALLMLVSLGLVIGY